MFTSGDPTIATVSATGLVTAVKTGRTSIVITSEGKQVTVPVEVALAPVATVSVTLPNATRLVGQTMQAAADLRDAQNNSLAGRPVVWTTADATVATVSPTGVVTAVNPGTTRIIATSEGKSGSGTVTVALVPVATVTTVLAATARFVGETTQGTATTKDSTGGVLTGRIIVWSSANTNIATVSQSGFVTAIAAGTTTITATSEGKSGTASLIVSPIPVARVVVTLVNSNRFVGENTQASAVVSDANGNVLTGRTIVWSSSNSNVAAVSQTGVVTTLGPGTADITATSETIVGKAPITVALAPVASVVVTLANASRLVGQTTQATAVLRDALGNVLTARAITWSSSDQSVATVSPTGLVTAVAAGVRTITAIAEGVVGSATITVALVPVSAIAVTATQTALQPGQTSQATAVTRDSIGGLLTGRAVVWSSSNTTIATISATGLITANASGTSTITASSEGKSGTLSLTVTFTPVATVSVTIDKPLLFIGYTAQATSITRDASTNVLSGRVTSWTSSNPSVAAIAANGVITALAAGVTTIIGTSEGKTGAAILTVSIAPVEFVTISATSTTILVGQTTQAEASLSDINNRPLTGRPVLYSSSNEAVATVTQGGVVRGVGVGSANINAESEGKGGFVTIRVSAVPVVALSVSLTGNTSNVLVGGVVQARAEPRDVDGNVLTGRFTQWTSSNPAQATVDANGNILGKLPGTVTITATVEGKTADVLVVVVLAPVSSLSLNLGASTIQIQQTTPATVVLRDVNNNVLTGRTVLYYTTTPAIATVNASGVVLAIAPGTAFITASSEGVSTSVPVTVIPIPVSSVSVSLGNSNLVTGTTTQAFAVTRDASNNVLNDRSIVWLSSNPTVATVNANGLVTAVSAGSANIVANSEGQTGSALVTIATAPVAAVSVSVAPPAVIVGASSQATAVLRDANNNVLTGRTITWTSLNTAVATVDANGVVTSIAAGTANIRATSESVSNTTPFTVLPVPVNSVSVSLGNSNLVTGGSTQATAVTRDAANNVLTGRVITWISSNPLVATVDANGFVTSVGAGSANITATSESRSGFATVTVAVAPVATVSVSLVPSSIVAGTTAQAGVVLRDANNNVLTGRSVTWTSLNTAVATVDASGFVTSFTAGTVIIRATSEGVSNTATLTVTLVPVNSVTVSLASTSVVVGATTQASAVTRDASNNVLTGRAIAWSSSNPAVATVDANGLVTSVGAGSANITAASETKTGFATLTVTVQPVATVTVTLAPTTVVAGQTSQASTVMRDINGTVLTGRTIVWSSSNTSVATVSATGLVTTLTAGTASIIATSETKVGQATLTVNAPVATVAVSLTQTTVTTGATPQASAVLRDAGSNVLTGRAIVWSSSNASVATVDANGLVTTLSAGTANIIATSETKTGFATLTVNAPLAPVATIAVTVNPASVIAGATSQATAVLRDASNNVLTGRAIAWTSSNTAVATVDANGLVTTLTAGSSNITATSETKSGFATLTVNPSVATVAVTLNPTSVVAGATSQATAVLRDAGNNVLTGRTIVWTSSNTAVATVNSSGVVATLTAGSTTITATSETKSNFATLTVTAPPAPVATVAVALNPTSVISGTTSQATAVLRDASNNVLTGRAIAWTSSNTAVATVDANGLVTTLTAGSSNITATSETKSNFATLTVTAPPAPVATVAVTLNPTSVLTGATSQASAVLRDAGNNVLTGRAIVWTSSNTAVATVDANGLVTTLTAGSSNITATSETKSNFATLTVTAPVAPVATVAVALNPTSVISGATSQATAVLRDCEQQRVDRSRDCLDIVEHRRRNRRRERPGDHADRRFEQHHCNQRNEVELCNANSHSTSRSSRDGCSSAQSHERHRRHHVAGHRRSARRG